MSGGSISRRGFLGGGHAGPGHEPEFAVSSVLVQARPDDLARLEPRIAALPGASVHASGGAGKLVAVIEAPSDSDLVRRIDEIGALPGVLSVNLIFHHTESADEEEPRDG